MLQGCFRLGRTRVRTHPHGTPHRLPPPVFALVMRRPLPPPLLPAPTVLPPAPSSSWAGQATGRLRERIRFTNAMLLVLVYLFRA